MKDSRARRPCAPTLLLVALTGLAALLTHLLSLPWAGPAFSLTLDDVTDATERAKELEGTIDMSNVHRDDMRREAEKSFRVFRERRMKDVEALRGRMHFDGERVTVAPVPTKPESATASGGALTADERVYVFISSSMPRTTLTAYARDIDRLRDSKVAMVMRGCVGGCAKIMPTVALLREILMPSADEKYLVDVVIDPMLYRFYGIRSVPAIVYARNVSTELPDGSEGNAENMKTTPVAHTIFGDVSLAYALETINRKAGSQGLARLVTQLQKKN
jgi:type-F conjugative transfer system pilin assembly protein TrbC